MSGTYGDLIQGAYRLSGVLGEDQIMSGYQSTQGLAAFNEMVDAWNSNNLNVYTISILTIPIVALKQTYTVGPAGDFNVPTRPPFLEGAWFQLVTVTPYNDIPITLLSEADWGNVRAKGIQGGLATFGYYDQNYPLANFNLWPIPNGGGNLIIHAGSMLNSAVLLTDPVALPPAYQQSLRYNLALLLCSENGLDPLENVVSVAINTKAALEKNNGQQQQRMEFDSGVMGVAGARYLITSDSFRN